jgi:hypothetical protein
MEICGQPSGMDGVLLALMPAVKNDQGLNFPFHAQHVPPLAVLI